MTLLKGQIVSKPAQGKAALFIHKILNIKRSSL